LAGTNLGQGQKGQGHARYGLLVILIIFWFIVACLVTFRGPFEQTGNIYFGSWAADAASSMAAFAANKGM